MLQSISYLNIKPFETFSGRVRNRKTTITSFESMLKEEKTVRKTETEAEKADIVDATEKKEEECVSENKLSQSIVYKDPLTGKEVV